MFVGYLIFSMPDMYISSCPEIILDVKLQDTLFLNEIKALNDRIKLQWQSEKIDDKNRLLIANITQCIDQVNDKLMVISQGVLSQPFMSGDEIIKIRQEVFDLLDFLDDVFQFRECLLE